MTNSKLKAKAALASQIAMIDREKFNGAVADGFYPCAPSTVRGSTRVFDVNDIVCLRVYGKLLEEGLPPRFAGTRACGLRELLSRYPDAERVVYVEPDLGSGVWKLSEDFDSASDFISGISISSVREHRLKNIRDRVVFDLTEAASVIGDDD